MVAKLVESEQERYAKAEGWDEGLVAAWRGDLVELDALEVSVADRVQMSDSLALLNASYESEVEVGIAPHWRINTGLFQSQTTLVGEMNLACALAAHEKVSDVSFQAVWGAGFEMAEREGDPEDNLVAWIISCSPNAAEPVADEPADEELADEEPTDDEASADDAETQDASDGEAAEDEATEPDAAADEASTDEASEDDTADAVEGDTTSEAPSETV